MNGKIIDVIKFGYEWIASWQEYRFVIEGRDIICSDIRWSFLLWQLANILVLVILRVQKNTFCYVFGVK